MKLDLKITIIAMTIIILFFVVLKHFIMKTGIHSYIDQQI